MDLRIIDVFHEHGRSLLPIEGYENFNLVTLEEAIEPLISFFPPDSLMQRALIAKERCNSPADGLSQDESASIMLYTIEWSSSEESFYFILNDALRTEDRDKLKPWFPYLRLFIGALSKLPPVNNMVYRGIRKNVKSEYSLKSNKIWWGFSSCTNNIKIFESERFCGTTGIRTIFNIRCLEGRDIRNHSYFSNESEILLLPGRYFEVHSDYQSSDGLTIINLVEIQPRYKLLKLPAHNLLHQFKPGISLLGICCNSQCSTYKKEVIISIGFKNFDVLIDTNCTTSKCPICEKYVESSKLVFHRCRWRIYGKKQKCSQAPFDFSTDWTSTNNEFVEYTLHEQEITWRQCIIEVTPI